LTRRSHTSIVPGTEAHDRLTIPQALA
jgi:hypothetical protein